MKAGNGLNLLRRGTVVLVWLVIVASVCPVIAVDNSQIFVKKCGACHMRGSDIAPINPADKAGMVWVKYFQRRRHPVQLASTISKDEMVIILDYLQEHAADSEVPVAAAIPK